MTFIKIRSFSVGGFAQNLNLSLSQCANLLPTPLTEGGTLSLMSLPSVLPCSQENIQLSHHNPPPHFNAKVAKSLKVFVPCAATHPGDVGDDFEGDPAAGNGAAWRHPLQQALSETLRHSAEKTTWQMSLDKTQSYSTETLKHLTSLATFAECHKTNYILMNLSKFTINALNCLDLTRVESGRHHPLCCNHMISLLNFYPIF